MFRKIKPEMYARQLAEQFNWTNVYGLARTILAIGSIITLLFNDIQMLVQPLGEFYERDSHVNPLMDISIFALMDNHLELAKWITIALLLVIASGWRPRFTGPLHWWLAFSIWSSAMVIDGGDQITAVLTFLLIPLCLADSRKWHWDTAAGSEASAVQKHFNLLAILSLLAVRIQVAFIYFHASVGKMGVEEWLNGTALYYWSHTPLFMLPDWLSALTAPIYNNSLTITLATWSIMGFELLLFMGLVIAKKWRPVLLVTGILFHFTIILMYGLVSFFCAMSAALVLLLGPHDKGFNFSFVRKHRSQIKRPTFSTKQPLNPQAIPVADMN